MGQERKPQPHLGDVTRPVHHLYAVQRSFDDPPLAVTGPFLNAQLSIGAFLQVVQHAEHAHKERTRTARRVQDRNVAEQPSHAGPNSCRGRLVVGDGLFLLLERENEPVEQVLRGRAQVVGEVVDHREPAHEVDFRLRRVENARVSATVAPFVDQALAYLADHLRIDGSLLIPKAIFHNSEVVLFEKGEDLLEPLVGDCDPRFQALAVKFVLAEQADVDRGREEDAANFLRETPRRTGRFAAVQPEEDDVQPFRDERVLASLPVSVAPPG